MVVTSIKLGISCGVLQIVVYCLNTVATLESTDRQPNLEGVRMWWGNDVCSKVVFASGFQPNINDPRIGRSPSMTYRKAVAGNTRRRETYSGFLARPTLHAKWP